MIRIVTAPKVLLFVICLSDSVLAAEPASTLVSPVHTLGKLVLALLFVLTVFWVCAYVVRQLQGAKADTHGGLKVVASLSLGQRERVVVVQAGDEQLLLGVTASQVNTLHILPKPLSTGSEQHGDFRQTLNSALTRQTDQ